MTHCSAKSTEFTRLAGRRVEADFNGGTLVTDAGSLLLREVDQHLGLTERFAACIADWRDPSRITHEIQTMAAQRIFGIASGCEDLNDHSALRTDAAIPLAVERTPDADQPLASPSTLCRLENHVTRETCLRINELLVDIFIESFDEPPEELILDFDSTDDPVHGNQDGRFFHGYYDRYCFLPLYVVCGEAVLSAYLRPSNIDDAKHSRAILKLIAKKLRAKWPEVKIIVRADAGFCRWRLARWCDRRGMFYILGLARNERLERMSEAFADEAERRFNETGETQRFFHEISYGAKTWDRKRRVLVKAEHLATDKRNLRFVLTNLEGEPQALYEDVYCQRGDMENRIKEQQLGLFADRTSCSNFIANQFRLLLSTAAYTLMQALRRLALKGTELEHAQATTLRLKLVKMAARVTVSARRVLIRIASSHPSRAIFEHAAERLRQLRLTPE